MLRQQSHKRYFSHLLGGTQGKNNAINPIALIAGVTYKVGIAGIAMRKQSKGFVGGGGLQWSLYGLQCPLLYTRANSSFGNH